VTSLKLSAAKHGAKFGTLGTSAVDDWTQARWEYGVDLEQVF
jgi:hypothetical protein